MKHIILVPLQTGMFASIKKIYNCKNESAINEITNACLKVGATTIAGKTLLEAIKKIPGVNGAGLILNAIAASIITAITGEAYIFVMDKVYKGELDLSATIDWEKIITDFVNDKLPDIVQAFNNAAKDVDAKDYLKTITNAVFEYFGKKAA